MNPWGVMELYTIAGWNYGTDRTDGTDRKDCTITKIADRAQRGYIAHLVKWYQMKLIVLLLVLTVNE